MEAACGFDRRACALTGDSATARRAHAGFPPARLALTASGGSVAENYKSGRALSPTSVPSRKSNPRLSSPARRAAALIVVTQMTGWGTTYHLPIILGGPLSRDLGLPIEIIFGGIGTLMIVALWTRVFPELFHVDEAQSVRPAGPSR